MEAERQWSAVCRLASVLARQTLNGLQWIQERVYIGPFIITLECARSAYGVGPGPGTDDGPMGISICHPPSSTFIFKTIEEWAFSSHL